MEDKDIIRLYFNRSEDAIIETNKKYNSYLKFISYNILHNNEDVDEILNDAYEIIWNKVPPLSPTSLKYYLSKIVRNLSLKRLEYQKASKRDKNTCLLLSEIEKIIEDKKSNIEKNFELNEITNIINTFLSTLSNEECGIFISRFYYFQTIKEISNKYNISERKIKYILLKLKNKLRIKFEEEGIIG